MKKRSATLLSGLIVGILVVTILASSLRALSGRVTPVTWPSSTPGSASADGRGDVQLINGYQRLHIPTQNVQAVIRTLARPQQYAQTVSLTLFWDAAQKSTISAVCATVGDDSAAVVTQGETVQHSIWGNGTLYRWYQGDQDWFRGKVAFMTPDLLQMIPTYENILALAPEQIQVSRYEELRGQTCIYVETFDEADQIRTSYWVDAVQGLLLQAEAFQEERRIWRAEITKVSTANIDESIFLLPNGKDARKRSS